MNDDRHSSSPMSLARWTARLEGGPRRVNHAAAAVPSPDRVFSFGGYCTGDNYKDRTVPIDVFVLYVDVLRWRALPRPSSGEAEQRDDEGEEENEGGDTGPEWPFQRYGHTVAAHGDQIYLFGGRNDLSPCNVLYKFDTDTCTWSRPKVSGQVPAERDGHSACVIRGFMYIFGGYEETHYRFGLDVYRLNLTTMYWELVHCEGDPPIYRDFHTATALSDRYMVIFGGRSDLSIGLGDQLGAEFYTNKLHYLDTADMTWQSPVVSPPPQAWEQQCPDATASSSPSSFQVPDGRRSHSAVSVGDCMLIFGGYNGRRDRHYNDLWLLEPTPRWTWRRVRPGGGGPNRRRRQAMCMASSDGSRIVLFGGTSPYYGPPLFFTEEQKALMPEHDNSTSRLIDHNDLYVLDLKPTLKTLCMQVVIEKKLPICDLPLDLQREHYYLTRPNSISTKLKTLPLG